MSFNTQEIALRIAFYSTPQTVGRLAQCSRNYYHVSRDNEVRTHLHAELQLPLTGAPFVDQIRQFCLQFFTIIPSSRNMLGSGKTLAHFREMTGKSRRNETRLNLFRSALKKQFTDVAYYLHKSGFARLTNYQAVRDGINYGAEPLAVALLTDRSLVDFEEKDPEPRPLCQIHMDAIERQQPETLRCLLVRIPLSPMFRDALLSHALSMNRSEQELAAIITPILEHGISQHGLIYALNLLIGSRGGQHLQPIQLVLQRCGKIPSSIYCKLLFLTAKLESDTVFNLLKTHGPLEEVYLDQHFQDALNLYPLMVAGRLMTCGTLSEKAREEAIEWSLNRNQFAFALTLLKSGPISSDFCEIALITAQTKDLTDPHAELLAAYLKACSLRLQIERLQAITAICEGAPKRHKSS